MLLDLQLFADGGGDGGGTGAAASPADTGDGQGVLEQDPVAQAYRQKREAKQGRNKVAAQPEPYTLATEAPQQPAIAQPKDRTAAFEELIKGEYKDIYNERMQATIKDRLKNSKGAEETLEKLSPALQTLAKKMGIDPGDFTKLAETIMDDDSLYEDEAIERGIPVETLKEMKSIQREADELRAQAAQTAEQKFFENHLQGLVQQGEQLRQLYPNFDLQQELQNPTFARLTSPGGHIDVRTAYEVVHKDEIQPAMAATVAQRTAENLSRTIQSGARRPSESGMNSSQNSNVLSNDPENWTREMRDRVRKDVKAGKQVRF